MIPNLALAAFLGTVAAIASDDAPSWKAGIARRDVTPGAPIWMAGYAARTAPSEGIIHPLWVRALAIEDSQGSTGLLLTLDVCGVDRAFGLELRRAIGERHGLGLERVVLACSHTHSGPVVGSNLITMYPLDEIQRKRVAEYTTLLRQAALEAASEALADREPASLERGLGRAQFGINRRNNDQSRIAELRAALALAGPNDPDVPILTVRSQEGSLRAIVFGYACHCTTLQGNLLTNDYAGFAQAELETVYPGATAFYWAGCGGDQNPLPRGTLDLAEQHGLALANAVRAVVEFGAVRPVSGPLVAGYQEIPIPFDDLPERGHWEALARSDNPFESKRAQALLARIEAEGQLSPTYPYPIQAWRFGNELLWIFMGGEVVVDYALRLKRNLGADRTWVAAYCNDVMAYIPSRRVWEEGGYEGGGAMLYYGLPTRWGPQVEDVVIQGVRAVVDAVGRLDP
ncbi:MAG: alkaline ceramidase [Isosphaeraceae bacterium]|jgi:hypothetical protein|nr:MAG: alkaline ceramidase [Isosphaeraceae bacterium]